MAKNVPAINTHFEIVFHTAGNFIFIKTKTEAEKIVARMKAEKKILSKQPILTYCK